MANGPPFVLSANFLFGVHRHGWRRKERTTAANKRPLPRSIYPHGTNATSRHVGSSNRFGRETRPRISGRV